MKWEEIVAQGKTNPSKRSDVTAIVGTPVTHAIMEAHPVGTYTLLASATGEEWEKVTPERINEVLQELQLSTVDWRVFIGDEELAK